MGCSHAYLAERKHFQKVLLPDTFSLVKWNLLVPFPAAKGLGPVSSLQVWPAPLFSWTVQVSAEMQ